jgi:hypothetical protein
MQLPFNSTCVKKNLFLFFILFNLVLSAQTENINSGTSAQKVTDNLANSVAGLIIVPLRNNLTYGIDPYVSKYHINIQPVFPFNITQNRVAIITLSPKVGAITKLGSQTMQFAVII